MLTSLVIGTALAAPGAPVPRDTTPAPNGPAPWVLYLKADANGRASVVAYTTQKVKVTRTVAQNQNGKVVTRQVQEEITRTVPRSVTMTDAGARFATVGGRVLTAGEVMKRAKDGVVVLVSADGKPVEKAWLLAIKDDAIVVTADALSGSHLPPTTALGAPTAAPRLVMLGTDADGKVKVACSQPGAGANAPGGGVVVLRNAAGAQQLILRANVARPLPSPAAVSGEESVRPLEDVAFNAYDLNGMAVTREAALKRLKAGGMVLIAGDNQVPNQAYLDRFRGDLLVLVSAQLTGVPANPVIRPGVVRPLPEVVPALPLAPAAPAVIPGRPVRLAPAVIRPLPARVKPAVEKTPVERPAEKREK